MNCSITKQEIDILNIAIPALFYGNKCKQLNQQYVADLIFETYEPIFYQPEQEFYFYFKKVGLWQRISKDKLKTIISVFLDILVKHLAKIRKMQEANNKNNENNESKKGDDNSEIDAFAKAQKDSFYSAVVNLLKGIAENTDAFKTTGKRYVHCDNLMVQYNLKSNEWEATDYSRKYYSRNQNPLTYDPDATCPRFIESLLSSALTEDDIEHIQLYIGQCLLGENISQTFLLLTGTPGGGKSTLVNVIEGIVGRINCTELRVEHMGSRFELSRTFSKTLLTGKDVKSDFLKNSNARILKALTGGDVMTSELKNSNVANDIVGKFNIIITSNAMLRIELDDDYDAWKRRLIWIKYENPPPEEKIPDFDKLLLEEEGSGILNWALEGAAKLLRNGGIIDKSTEQESRINMLLSCSNSFEFFGKNFIQPDPFSTLTTEEATSSFLQFCSHVKWPLLSERQVQKLFHQYMRTNYPSSSLRTDIKRNGRNKRGYSGFIIKKK